MTNEKIIMAKYDYHELCTVLGDAINFVDCGYDVKDDLNEMKRPIEKAEPYKEDN